MILDVKTKTRLYATVGKKEIILQKVGSDHTKFPLMQVQGYSDKDLEFIMKSIPEFAEQQMAIRQYLNDLEGNKRETLDILKAKYRSIVDAQPMDVKFRAETEFKCRIDYEAVIDQPYITDILDYDPLYNNVLTK